MTHYPQMPLPLSILYLLYQETKARVISLNQAVAEQHFTHFDTVLDNVVLIDVKSLSPMEQSFLQIGPEYPSEAVWTTNTAEKDWEILWKWKPALKAAQFTLYARGLGQKSPPEKPFTVGIHSVPDPNSGRSLIRLSYVINDVHVTPDNWIEWLDRDAKPNQWREVIRFFGFLGKSEFWNPIIHALKTGKPCIPLRTV